ncbi:PLD nuclease N-terminal domain-containing protein [Streptomyces flaveolus]|uniref:PLD nuclease N-terminal domain-containing protein n=1 Tax=Streptomyces flaveolus TaxID=67297 RepID=UPI0033C20C16
MLMMPAQHFPLAAHSVHAAGLMGVSLIVLVLLLHATLFVGALISITTSGLGGGMKLIWIAFAFIAPFLGSLLWFIFGWSYASRQRQGAVDQY